MTRSECLNKAESIVNGEREEQYGKPEDNFAFIAKLWNVWLNKNGVVSNELTAHDVAVMMTMLKLARIGSGQRKDDNYIDACGYLACAAEIAFRTATYRFNEMAHNVAPWNDDDKTADNQ